MNDMNDKLNNKIKEEDVEKIIYLNNKIFEERMKKYSEKIRKSDYVYYEGRVRKIKDFENIRDIEYEIKKPKTNNEYKVEVFDDTKEDNFKDNEEKKTNYYKQQISFRMKRFRKKLIKTFAILSILYVSPFVVNSFIASGMNVFIALGLIMMLVYIIIMLICII